MMNPYPLPIDLSSSPVAPSGPDFSALAATQMPQMKRSGGMFGGMQINPGNAIAGFLAGMYPRYADSFLAPMMARENFGRQAQLAMLQNNFELQRQMQLAKMGAELKMYESPLAQTLLARGIAPGSQEWNSAFSTNQANLLDPVVNAGPYGPVLRSQVSGAANAKPLTDEDILKLSGAGGQSGASPTGGFLGQ